MTRCVANNEENELKAERGKGVKLALIREKELVLQGKGTRNWNKRQQTEIVSGYQPTDEYGEAYQGHHMISVKGNGEYGRRHAANPDNIQWLTTEEHAEAHYGGNYRIPVNGYYDPKTQEMGSPFRFGPKAPTAQPLSKPYFIEPEQSHTTSETETESESTDQSISR